MRDTRPIQKLTKPFVDFMHVQSASGVVLMVCAAIALAAAASPWQASYAAFWEHRFVVGTSGFALDYPLWYWINDALMAVFFFVVGLEIKREVVVGELREPRRMVLPLAGAVGGAVVPAAAFMVAEGSGASADAWAVPMATDIAFVVGVLALLGERVPKGLKVFLVSLAIVDDLISVLVIAIFYTDQIHASFLGGAFIGLVVVLAMNRLGIRAVAAYAVVGIAVWVCTLKSGVHPTIAGVLLGLLTPTRALLDDAQLERAVSAAHEEWRDEADPVKRRAVLADLEFAAREASSPLLRLETALHPWVAFAIIPAFALVNAAVVITPAALSSSLAITVALCLFIGKPAGIVAVTSVCVRLGWASLPSGVSWSAMLGAGFLAGIGFTMSLFVTALALDGTAATYARTGVLLGSAASGLVGAIVLRRALRPAPD